MIYYDRTNILCKSHYGAVTDGTMVDFSVFCDEKVDIARLTIYRDGEAINMMNMHYDWDKFMFTASYTFATPGLYFYSIYIDGFYCGWNGFLVPEEHRYQQTVYSKDYVQPKGYAGGIMYQIFPDRFCIGDGIIDSGFSDRIIHTDIHDLPKYLPDPDGEFRNDDYFGGNLRGIISKIPYLKSLNVSMLYLNPIFEAHSNHRYNTADYMKIDPLLGTEDDLVELCAKCKDAGIRVILDGVFSHIGSDSIYFNANGRYDSVGAANSTNSPYRKWFKLNDDGTYTSWWGFKTLPEVDEDEPSYSEFICGDGGVIDHWMKLGVSGFRLDVADELPDDFIKRIRERIKSFGDDRILIGEVWEDASNKISYGVRREYLLGDELDSVMNYPFREAIIEFMKSGNAAALRRSVESIIENYPEPMLNVMMNSLSTHDTERIITAVTWDGEGDREVQASVHLGKDEYMRAVELVKLAMVLQFTLPGVPCIYYGDEIGMQGCKDPFNRRFFGADNFDENLLEFTRELSRVRSSKKALVEGRFVPVECREDVFAFRRESKDDSVFVAVNRSEETHDFSINGKTISVLPWNFVIK